MFDQVYLTGFKIFGGVECNPTQLLAEHYSKAGIKNLSCEIVEVAAKCVDEYVEKVKECEEKSEESEGKRILNLHFGVGPNKIYHL